MHFIVDGYNYLRRARLFATAPLDLARRRLVARLRVLGSRGERVTVVWDARRAPPGAPAREAEGSVDQVFARRGDTADDEILARIRASDHPGSICVISDDRDVSRPARQLGATSWSIREAEERVLAALGSRPAATAGTPPRSGAPDGDPPDEKPRAPRGPEVAEWLEFFGVDPEDPLR